MAAADLPGISFHRNMEREEAEEPGKVRIPCLFPGNTQHPVPTRAVPAETAEAEAFSPAGEAEAADIMEEEPADMAQRMMITNPEKPAFPE